MQIDFDTYLYISNSRSSICIFFFQLAAFAASSVVESVKKAQAEISAAILQRGLSICKNDMVIYVTLHHFITPISVSVSYLNKIWGQAYYDTVQTENIMTFNSIENEQR